MDKLIVILGGSIAIAFIYWFFFGKRQKAVTVEESVDIIVEGGYKPDAIEVKKGRSVTINFIRKDKSSCLEEVVLADFKIRKFLPIGERVSITLNPKNSGEYGFSCGMNMFHGKIIVL